MQNPGNHDPANDDLLDEYDFSDAVVGKYAERSARGTNLVLLDPDVAEMFPDATAVNEALRAVANVIRARDARSRAA